MANQWGRKETIIWPPHVPVMSYSAVATAILCTCFFLWQRLHFSLPPLQRSYLTEYIRSQAGATFHAHESYRLLYLAGGKAKPRLALPVDFTAGSTRLPDGSVLPFGLSELARVQGYRFPFRAPLKSSPMCPCTAGSRMRSMTAKGSPASSPSASSRVASALS